MEEHKELGFCPSFSCYSSNTAETAARVSIQCQQENLEQEFEFSPTDIVCDHKTQVFPFFNRDLLTEKEHIVVCDGPNIDSLQNLFISERDRDRELEKEEYASSSESESEEEGSGMFCVWRNNKTDQNGAGSPLSKCKKSSSTGSGSKRWRIKDLLLMRSNSEGKEPPMILFTDNNNDKVDLRKEKGNSGEVAVYSGGKTKPKSIHELFYVQQRAKRQDGKRKSYLPYRQGLIGRFF
uniref:uncharacterized protein LOC122605782 n=1 Tax=Erigeron canadensis TaxID=72917 RepID=UPI001CB8AE78|nr:uncharacterized protein LOC122605782 [Erigeron canadensis]